ncbi:DUF202 domain-containing protein [Rhodococcus sp. NPDC058505]|uniref:DUF202 domain-containing protein n=1 Tax=unclassified Rhodococcus (in: high G+C Gram-positive bacteria) TaxID=192944 RepID=UPI00364785CB
MADNGEDLAQRERTLLSWYRFAFAWAVTAALVARHAPALMIPLLTVSAAGLIAFARTGERRYRRSMVDGDDHPLALDRFIPERSALSVHLTAAATVALAAAAAVAVATT